MKTAILGIGNILQGDDGIGVHIVNRLKDEYLFPDSVSIVDGGTMGLDLLVFLEDNDRVLIVDAIDFHKEPGTIKSLTGDEIPEFLTSKLSVHQIGLSDMLFAARLRGVSPPEVCLIGIQPKSVDTGLELSREVKARFEVLLKTVLQKLKDWGIKPVPKGLQQPA